MGYLAPSKLAHPYPDHGRKPVVKRDPAHRKLASGLLGSDFNSSSVLVQPLTQWRNLFYKHTGPSLWFDFLLVISVSQANLGFSVVTSKSPSLSSLMHKHPFLTRDLGSRWGQFPVKPSFKDLSLLSHASLPFENYDVPIPTKKTSELQGQAPSFECLRDNVYFIFLRTIDLD